MAATTTPPQFEELPQKEEASSAPGISSQREDKTWKGWMVGTYVHAWLPEQAHCDPLHRRRTKRKHPALLVDIRKEATGDAQFVVALLYDWDAVAQRFRELTGCARWIASLSLLRWPRASTHVLGNQLELVYEWRLSTWWRSSPLSISTHWTVDTRTNRLAKRKISSTSDVGRALNTTFDFQQFLRLPPEVRDIVYEYTLLDERQGTSRSRIHTHSLLLKRLYGKRGWPWYRHVSLPALGPLPMLHTPSILRVCRQVQREALDTLYRTKILVVTVTSAGDDLSGLTQKWSLDMLYFRRIRVDLILASITAGEVRMCLRRVAGLLEERALSLQVLEVRIGFSHVGASAAVRDHGFALLLERKDIAESMRELVPLVQRQGRRGSRGYKPLQVEWGISETQRKAGDYSCACTYLRASILRPIWGRVCQERRKSDSAADPVLADEDCRQLGCKRHQC